MRKLLIAEESIQFNNVKARARKYKACASRIHKRKHLIPILIEDSKISPKKLTSHRGKPPETRELQFTLVDKPGYFCLVLSWN